MAPAEPELREVELAAGEAVVLLPPEVRVGGVRALDLERVPPPESVRRLGDQIARRLESMGIDIVGAVGDDEPDAAAVPASAPELEDSLRELASPYCDKSRWLPALQRLGRASGARLAALLTVELRVGRPGAYDPMSGAIAQSTSTGDLRLALISLPAGRVEYAGHAWIRKGLETGDAEPVAEMLLRGLSVRTGEPKR